MHIVATLGAFRMKSEELEKKLTMKHSSPDSCTKSDMMDMEIHFEVLDDEITNDPLSAV